MPTCGQAATKATEVMAAEAPSAVSPVSTITGPPDQPSESAARNVVQSQVASEWVAKQAVATSEAMRDIFLLVLNDKTWEAGASSERLAALFNSVLVLKKYSRIPAKILLVHVVDPSIGGVLQFDHFFQVTPSDLLAMGIYTQKSQPWFAESSYKAISICEIAKELQAQPVKHKPLEVASKIATSLGGSKTVLRKSIKSCTRNRMPPSDPGSRVRISTDHVSFV